MPQARNNLLPGDSDCVVSQGPIRNNLTVKQY
jgi:hypothetical protein